MRSRAYCAHPSIRDHWALRCMSRCRGQPEVRPQCPGPQASLVAWCTFNDPLQTGGFYFLDIAERLGRNVITEHDCWHYLKKVPDRHYLKEVPGRHYLKKVPGRHYLKKVPGRNDLKKVPGRGTILRKSRVGIILRKPGSSHVRIPTDRKDNCIRRIAVEHRNVSETEIIAFVGTRVTQRTVTNRLFEE
ncbi:hypothetical protein TNCV_1875671 [Trichonephila clavipes]|nr:hypothetical protein TNCV_1875671 [Trichonephila clavipes]